MCLYTFETSRPGGSLRRKSPTPVRSHRSATWGFSCSGQARPERDGSEPASGRRTRHAAVAELLLDRSNATLQRGIDETKPWPRKYCEGTALRSDATLQCMGRALLCISSPSPLGPKTNQKSALRFVASSGRTEPEGDLPPAPGPAPYLFRAAREKWTWPGFTYNASSGRSTQPREPGTRRQARAP
ncbi:hypothetical protein NDU88_003658 [Pleurodeles waltl]|uniref:Uncharacterized protein n=1 Tax=Pleurodeles waltl TaxID=8319 RepID=A0AAV7WPP1_PLEWA|nr:hypothetical protein NDU88_003658 [Pleurodeles waltl]